MLIFFCLISFVISDVNWIDYDYSTESATYVHDKASQTKTVIVEFKSNTPYYLKITVTPDENSSTPIVCFSPTDQTCTENREAMARRTDKKPAVLFVKKEQFSGNTEELHIQISCLERNCGYTFLCKGGQAAEIDANSVYSYVVSDDNKEMLFEVMGNVEEGSYLTIGIEGTSAQLEVDGQEKMPTYLGPTGRIITFPIVTEDTTTTNLAKFTVKQAKKGDYVTLNVHVVYQNAAVDNLLYPNGPVVMGMLDDSEGYYREECFPISAITTDFANANKFYLTGRIHSKYALFWLADEKDNYMEETEMEISDGLLSYLIETNGQKRSVCFEFSYDETVSMGYVAYSISILEPTKLQQFYNFYPPQTVGQTYRRLIPRGSIAVYHAGNLEESGKYFTFNMYTRKGAVEMYVDYCTTFPDCTYEPSVLSEDRIIKPKRINKMTIWETNIDKSYEPLDSRKNVMIVYCRDDDNNDKGYCEIESSIYTYQQEITLVENEKFYKYTVAGEKGSFLMDFKGGIKIQRLTVDIIVFSGDVNFDSNASGIKSNNGKLTDEEIEINSYKYYLSNKIFYHYNFAQLSFDSISLKYEAKLNSFFSIQYGINPTNLNQLEETVPSGESYLVQIDPATNEKYKTIYLQNYRYKKEQPFLANFFSLNCEFKVTREKEEIPFFDGYAQEILSATTPGYKAENYEYKIEIIEPDLSNYNHKMCMLYVAGFESKDSEYQTELVVAENVNQQVIFDDTFKTIRFLYPQSDSDKDLAIYFNVIDQAYYDVNIYANSEEKPFRVYTITRSQIYYILGSEITRHCAKDTLCRIIVEATFRKPLDNMVKTDPMIEITIRQLKNTPTYLQKGQAKKDFTCGDLYYYLYTDIGKNEVGEVLVNFFRDFGEVYGKVVRKDQTSVDEEANWRVYRMPSLEWEDSLPYNGYIKKFEVGIEETQDCIEGCYLLLSIRISQIGEYVDDTKFYPFSIITTITPSNHAYTDIPKVVIQVDEFIVGNVDVAENERISQFYEIWLPHDSYRVELDWQSEVAGLYVNVGGTRPTTKNAHFKLLPPGRDSILSIDKYNIIEKAKENKVKLPYDNSLQDLNFVIGVWTDKTDSIDTEVFSLRVHIPNSDSNLDITEVNTDQKILCSPRFVNSDEYRCLFMVTYDYMDVNLRMPLLVHAHSLNNSAVTNTYASYIERKYYDEFDVNSLRSQIPTSQTAQYSTLRDDIDYIYTKLDPDLEPLKEFYFFVNVISNKEDDIMIITSIPMFNVIRPDKYEFYPNPSGEQLLSVAVDNLVLKFFTSSSLLVNIVTLGGEADVAWSNEPDNVFYLRGRRDILSLTSGSPRDSIVITRRKTNNLADTDEAGFVFYISYYIRNAENNFDEIIWGQSLEIGYTDTQLPIFLYSKIGSYFSNLIIAVTFKDSDLETEGEYKVSPLIVRAALAKESTVYKAKNDPSLSPSLEKSIFGTYDPAIKTAHVFLDRDLINKFNIKSEDNPTLYLSMDKSEISEKTKTKFTVEAQVTKINLGNFIVEKTFNYGRFSGNFYNYYFLKNDKNKKYMIIEIAFNNEYILDYAINTIATRNNDTKIIKSAETLGGKKIILVETPNTEEKIVLNFVKMNYLQNNDLLFNYAFKYINIDKEEEFVKFKILNDDKKLTIEENEEDDGNTTIKCTFNKINVTQKEANVTYFFKVVENKTLIYGESYETIAVTESPYYTVYKRNPEDNNGKITLTARGALSNWAYLQIVAQIQKDTILDYIAYGGVENIRPPPYNPNDESNKNKTESSSKATTAFLVISSVLIILIAGLIVVVFIIQQRNKSLLNQVKHVSFQQNAGGNAINTTDPDLLLQKSQAS